MPARPAKAEQAVRRQALREVAALGEVAGLAERRCSPPISGIRPKTLPTTLPSILHRGARDLCL